MKTVDLNFRMVLLLGTFVVLSGMLVTSFFAGKTQPDYSSSSASLIPVSKTEQPGPAEQSASGTTSDIPVMEVVSSQVAAFIPEFDDEWCKAHYPGYEGKKINLQSHEFVVKDDKGTRITDYDELSLKLAPSGAEADKLEKRHNFKDAYVEVKGVGLMKIKAVRFIFSKGK